MAKISPIAPGVVFGRLTIVCRQGTLPDGSIKYLCTCKCGNPHVVAGTVLRKGSSRSCGCLVKENKGRTLYTDREQPAFNQVIVAYKSSATKRGVGWDLSSNNCRRLFKQPCFYCGDIETNCASHRPNSIYRYNGLDRVDPSLGYSIDNVVSCCFICNRAKNAMSMSDFKSWLNRITQHQSKRVREVESCQET